MDDESEIVRKNIGSYFSNMQELHNVGMIYVQEHSDKGIMNYEEDVNDNGSLGI